MSIASRYQIRTRGYSYSSSRHRKLHRARSLIPTSVVLSVTDIRRNVCNLWCMCVCMCICVLCVHARARTYLYRETLFLQKGKIRFARCESELLSVLISYLNCNEKRVKLCKIARFASAFIIISGSDFASALTKSRRTRLLIARKETEFLEREISSRGGDVSTRSFSYINLSLT